MTFDEEIKAACDKDAMKYAEGMGNVESQVVAVAIGQRAFADGAYFALDSQLVRDLYLAAKANQDHTADCLDKDEKFETWESCECGASSIRHAVNAYDQAKAEGGR